MAISKIEDLSKWDGTVDFSKAKDDLELAVLRVQCGSNIKDEKYQEYVLGCKQYNIPFGTYAYAKFVSVPDAIQEAKDCLSRLDKDTKFVVIDVEEVTTHNASDLVPATQAYIDYLHSNGIEKVGLYSGESFYIDHELNNVKVDFLWIARYGIDDGQPHDKPSVACDIWQYTSKGKVSGVDTDADLNMLVGNKTLDYFTGQDTSKQSLATTVVIPTGDGNGVLTVTTDNANVYADHEITSTIVQHLAKDRQFKYHNEYRGWYNVGSGWIRNVDVQINSFTPNPVIKESTPPANTNPIASGSTQPPQVAIPPVSLPDNTNVGDLAKKIADAVMQDPQLQKSVLQKFFSFFTSLFK